MCVDCGAEFCSIIVYGVCEREVYCCYKCMDEVCGILNCIFVGVKWGSTLYFLICVCYVGE